MDLAKLGCDTEYHRPVAKSVVDFSLFISLSIFISLCVLFCSLFFLYFSTILNNMPICVITSMSIYQKTMLMRAHVINRPNSSLSDRSQ